MVEITHKRNQFGIGCPNGKMHSRHSVNCHSVRAQFFVDLAMSSLPKEIEIELPQLRFERVRVFSSLVVTAAVFESDQVLWNFRYGKDDFPETSGVDIHEF